MRKGTMLRYTVSVTLGFMIAFLFSGIFFHLFNGKDAYWTDSTAMEWFGGTWLIAVVVWYFALKWMDL